tara:strand:- start:1194 stop:1658 length:465 start_codon:yes stop_codon:yes gene_type:complete
MSEKQVDQLEEKQKIVDLTIAYTWIIDHGPREKLREIFSEDAVFIIDTRHLNGIDEIRGKIERTLGGLSASQHIVSNHQVSIDGDTATSRCYLHAQHTLDGTEGGDNYVMAGRYIDRLSRLGNEWRITERQLMLDWTEGNPQVLSRRQRQDDAL